MLRVGDVVTEIDEELGEASLCCGVVTEDGLESCVAEGFGEALAQGFAGSVVVAQSGREEGGVSHQIAPMTMYGI